jgi:hypothetical protein
MAELAQTARALYGNISDEAVAFCERHSFEYEDQLQRTVLSMAEAILFAAIVNHFSSEGHRAAFNAVATGVVTQLREFAQNPDAFTHKFDA